MHRLLLGPSSMSIVTLPASSSPMDGDTGEGENGDKDRVGRTCRPQTAAAALCIELGRDEEAKTYKIWSRPPPCFTSSLPSVARSLHRHATLEDVCRRPPVLLSTGQRQSEERSRRLGF
jgi:hypothetical protein